MLSFLSMSGSGSTLPDPDPLVRGMDPDPDPDPNPSRILLQKSEYTTLSRPQQHSHSREKVLVSSLESALEAVRVSVEAVRVHSHGLN